MFLRRVYLDVAGRIPTVYEARAFFADKHPEKRSLVVDKLLGSQGYVNHFTNTWRALLLPEASSSLNARFAVPGFHAWLRDRVQKNVGYDELVRELLTTKVGQDANRGFNFNGVPGELSPVGFYLAKELKPENLSAGTTRLFLGVRLECAQCHDHPFATWKREQFWGMTAFFAGIQRQEQGDFVNPLNESFNRRDIKIPGNGRVVQAVYLDSKKPTFKNNVSSRVPLAEWMTAADNPYFARTAVNRMWAHFFGHGLVEPIDDMLGSESQAHHPELLDELARQFVAHKFDNKFLIQVITRTKAYQLGSAAGSKEPTETHWFARMAVKGLTPEQLFDSLALAVGFQEPRRNDRNFFVNDNSMRGQFLEKFAIRSDKPTEAQTTILQALSLMNGWLIAEATHVDRSETLAAVADAPFLDTSRRIETLYLASLSRPPRADEMARLVKYVENAGPDEVTMEGLTNAFQGIVNRRHPPRQINSRDQALADVFWAILNSSEFALNH